MQHYANPLFCILYLTTRCGGRCKHCTVRSDVRYRFNRGIDATYDTVIRRIQECKEIGIKFVELTGGDPLLFERLPEVLALCKELGLLTILSVSGPMIVKRLQDWGEEWIKLPWLLRFSIDGGKTYHDLNRGEGFYETACVGLEVARRVRPAGTTQLMFTIVPGDGGNIRDDQFQSVFQLAEKSLAQVIVNPMFGTEFSETKKRCDELWANLSRGEKLILNKLTGQKLVIEQSLAKIDFLLSGGNNLLLPTCRAAEAVVTISASDKLVKPCWHSQYSIIPIGERGLRVAALESDADQSCFGQSGKFSFCDGCTVWCNLGPSKAYSLSDPALQRLVIRGT